MRPRLVLATLACLLFGQPAAADANYPITLPSRPGEEEPGGPDLGEPGPGGADPVEPRLVRREVVRLAPVLERR